MCVCVCVCTVTDGLDLDGLGDPFLWVRQDRLAANLGLEQGVDQGGFTQTALPCSEEGDWS